MDPQLEPYLVQMYQSEVKQFIEGNGDEFLCPPFTLVSGVVGSYKKSEQPRALLQTMHTVTPKDHEPWHRIEPLNGGQDEVRHVDNMFELMKEKLAPKKQTKPIGGSPIMFF